MFVWDSVLQGSLPAVYACFLISQRAFIWAAFTFLLAAFPVCKFFLGSSWLYVHFIAVCVFCAWAVHGLSNGAAYLRCVLLFFLSFYFAMLHPGQSCYAVLFCWALFAALECLRDGSAYIIERVASLLQLQCLAFLPAVTCWKMMGVLAVISFSGNVTQGKSWVGAGLLSAFFVGSSFAGDLGWSMAAYFAGALYWQHVYLEKNRVSYGSIFVSVLLVGMSAVCGARDLQAFYAFLAVWISLAPLRKNDMRVSLAWLTVFVICGVHLDERLALLYSMARRVVGSYVY